MPQKTIVLVFLLLVSLLPGCSTVNKPLSAPVPVEDRSVDNSGNSSTSIALPDPTDEKHSNATAPAENSKQPLVTALLDQAEVKMQAGDNSSAAASLERALRLDSKNALLWHQLARLRLQQKNWQQAINLAKKSNTLAAGNYSLQLANWQLIAEANASAGDRQAAKLATEMAMKLERRTQ